MHAIKAISSSQSTSTHLFVISSDILDFIFLIHAGSSSDADMRFPILIRTGQILCMVGFWSAHTIAVALSNGVSTSTNLSTKLCSSKENT